MEILGLVLTPLINVWHILGNEELVSSCNFFCFYLCNLSCYLFVFPCCINRLLLVPMLMEFSFMVQCYGTASNCKLFSYGFFNASYLNQTLVFQRFMIQWSLISSKRVLWFRKQYMGNRMWRLFWIITKNQFTNFFSFPYKVSQFPYKIKEKKTKKNVVSC